MERIELVNENGQAEVWLMLSTFGMDDTMYAVLMKEEDDDEVEIMRVTFLEDGNAELTTIEDEEEREAAFEVFQELKDEEDE